MYTTQDYIDSLYKDRANIVKNLNEKGVEASADETFTQLAPKILNISTGGGEGIYLKNTVEEMEGIENPKENDFCVVYDKVIEGVTEDSVFQVMILPNTVVLDASFTDFVSVNYESTDPSIFAMVDCSLDQQQFRIRGGIDINGDFTSINVIYTSSDGITYIKEEPIESSVNLGTTVKLSEYSEWNNLIGKFIQITEINFEGIYQYIESAWSYLDIGTTATADDIWSPNTFYTSDGMQTSSLNKLSYPKQNVYIQSTEPTEKTGLWLTLLSEGAEEYNYTNKLTFDVSLVNAVRLDATLNNDENQVNSTTMPLSFCFCAPGRGGNMKSQVYDAILYPDYSGGKFSYPEGDVTYTVMGALFLPKALYFISSNPNTGELKFVKYTYDTNALAFIDLPQEINSQSFNNSRYMAYDLQSIIFGSDSLLVKFNIETEAFTVLNPNSLGSAKGSYVLTEISSGLRYSVFYKDLLFYSYDNAFYKVNITDGTTEEIATPNSKTTLFFQPFFMGESPVVLVQLRGNDTLYEFNLETLEFTSTSLTQFPLATFRDSVSSLSSGDDVIFYINNKFICYQGDSNSGLYISDADDSYNMSVPINCYITFNESSFLSKQDLYVYYDSTLEDYKIYVVGGSPSSSASGDNYVASNLRFDFTLSQLENNLISIPFGGNRFSISGTNSSSVMIFLLQDYTLISPTNVTDNLLIPIKDVLLYHNNVVENAVYTNDIKDIYIGDGTSWKLLKSHTVES